MKYYLRLLASSTIILLLVLSLDYSAVAASKRLVKPFESSLVFRKVNPIDKYILDGLNKQRLTPAALCSDEVFVRRVFLDIIGTIPSGNEVTRFLKDRRFDKRSRLIEQLMARNEFADYWALKWGDLLRIKAEFPINLWPNAVQAYNRWIHEAIKKNMPYNEMVTSMLVSSGSNFRVPQVNFYRALQGHKPDSIAQVVALTFMGVRLNKWPEQQQKNMAVFFSRVAYKRSAEWKEEIVFTDPKPLPDMKATLPDWTEVKLKSSDDPRRVFAKWLTGSRNPWFAKNIVNRIWSWLMGRGLIDPPDDIRDDNLLRYPKLLAYLEEELINSGYDLRHIYRLILNSRTYQQSAIPRSKSVEAEQWFACYPVRRLDAEVLSDALCMITGTRERYSSMIPEPFTFVPEENRSIALSDGSITSQFLEMFGRPSRDTGLESERNNNPTDAQRLHLLNSTHIQNKLERSWKLRQLLRRSRKKPRNAIKALYLAILSRHPTNKEIDVAEKYFKSGQVSPRQAAVDIAWALINSKEFVYRH
ncbi:MAG: DUF1553 domain-containing protein [Victivallaceae bacterium]|nr:DUF1553 domain-containing protein [Victivallaceae bacterium]